MTDEKPVIEIDHYNGCWVESFTNNSGDRVYGLIGMNKGSNDVWYPIYVFPSKWSQTERKGVPDTGKKARPVSLRLGVGKKAALENLDKIKKMLELI